MILKLRPHSTDSVAADICVMAKIERTSCGKLEVRYEVRGDIGSLNWPDDTPPGRKDYLWKDTCFELFIRSCGNDAYTEYNFSPSGSWAAYSFSAYRAGMKNADVTNPEIEVVRQPDSFILTACIALPGLANANSLYAGIAAIIADRSGNTVHWALAHTPGKPDFHNSDCFTHCL